MLNEILAIVFGLAVLTLFAVPLISRVYKQRAVSKLKEASKEEGSQEKTSDNVVTEPVPENQPVEKASEIIVKEPSQEGKASEEGTHSMEGKSIPVNYVSKEGESMPEDHFSSEGASGVEGEGSSEGEGYDEGFFGDDEEGINTFTKIQTKTQSVTTKSIHNLPDKLKIVLLGNVLNNKNDEY